MSSFLERHRGPIIGVVTVLGLAALIWFDAQPRGGPEVGSEAPSFELAVLDSDQKVRLSELRGQPVVLDFFATWCAPCRRGMPQMDRLAKEYEGKAHFFAVNAESEPVDLQRRFIKELDLELPVLPQGAGVASRYRVQAMPTTVVLGPDGVVKKTWVGTVPEKELRAQLDVP